MSAARHKAMEGSMVGTPQKSQGHPPHPTNTAASHSRVLGAREGQAGAGLGENGAGVKARQGQGWGRGSVGSEEQGHGKELSCVVGRSNKPWAWSMLLVLWCMAAVRVRFTRTCQPHSLSSPPSTTTTTKPYSPPHLPFHSLIL